MTQKPLGTTIPISLVVKAMPPAPDYIVTVRTLNTIEHNRIFQAAVVKIENRHRSRHRGRHKSRHKLALGSRKWSGDPGSIKEL